MIKLSKIKDTQMHRVVYVGTADRREKILVGMIGPLDELLANKIISHKQDAPAESMPEPNKWALVLVDGNVFGFENFEQAKAYAQSLYFYRKKR